MLTKTCAICGNDFQTDDHRARYCSQECQKEAQRRATAKWRANHPDYQKQWKSDHPEYMQEWTAEHPHYNRDKSRERRARLKANEK